MFTHIVMFKLKDRSTQNIATTRDKLLSMDGKISVLLHLEVGVDELHSERSYDIALVTKFAKSDDLQTYQVHPVHQEIIAYMKTVVETSITVDYGVTS